MGVKRGIFQSIRFEITKKKVGKRGGHFSTHGCAMDLKVVVIIKRKIINCENHANEATECTSGRTVTSILCGGGGGGVGGVGGANEAKVDQSTEMYFLLSDPFIVESSNT